MLSIITLTTHIALQINLALAQTTLETEGISRHSPQIRTLRIAGDVMIGGVFPVHSKASSMDGDSCGKIAETRGVHRVEAMLYALDQVNEQKELLRGLTLGAVIMDSCSNPAYALNQSLDFVRDMIGTSEGSDFVCSDGEEPRPAESPRKNVVAVVGGSYSSVTVQVANLLRLFRIVQVSPASTNADLSDKSRFEFFARTVPSDNYQARAMIAIAKEFNWTYVSLLYSADEYGELGAEAFKKEARKENICIATEERVMLKRESMRESINNLVNKLQTEKEVGAQVVILFVNTDYIPPLMDETVRKMKMKSGLAKKKIIWMASEGWDRNNAQYTSGERRRAAEGAIVLMLKSKRIPQFEQYYKKLSPNDEKFKRNPWLEELWREKFNCDFGLRAEETKMNRCEDQTHDFADFHADDKVQFTINAVYAIAHALDAMRKAECPHEQSIEHRWLARGIPQPDICNAMRKVDGARFYNNYLLKVKFNDSAGEPFHFSPEGDGPASYTILNYQPVGNGQAQDAEGMQRYDYVEVGEWTEGKLVMHNERLLWSSGFPRSVCSRECEINERKQLIKDEQCCWACVKCEDYEFLPNETACIDCGEGMWPYPNRSSCYNISSARLQYMRWTSAYAVVPVVFATLGIVGTLFVIVTYILYNETPVVKASGRELSYMLLIAMIMCYMMTFVLLAKPSKISCAIKRTGIGFAFSCLYSALLVKTNRIARIFSKTPRTAIRPICISPLSQLALCGLLAGFQLFYSVVWLIIIPAGVRHVHPTRAEVVLTCNIPDHHFLYSLVYIAALIILCTYYAVKTRRVPENFNETKFIGFTMYTTCVLWLTWIFFFIGTGNDFQIQTSSLCIAISMSANAALICIFSPKIWIILFEKHKNVRKPDGEYMLKRSQNNHSTIGRNSTTYGSTAGEDATPATALLSEQQRRRSCRRTSQPSTASSAHDTFL